jgi:hypothetical protein
LFDFNEKNQFLHFECAVHFFPPVVHLDLRCLSSFLLGLDFFLFEPCYRPRFSAYPSLLCSNRFCSASCFPRKSFSPPRFSGFVLAPIFLGPQQVPRTLGAFLVLDSSFQMCWPSSLFPVFLIAHRCVRILASVLVCRSSSYQCYRIWRVVKNYLAVNPSHFQKFKKNTLKTEKIRLKYS